MFNTTCFELPSLLKANRYLTERGNFESAMPLYKLALVICEEQADAIPELFADILFSLSSMYGELNNPSEALKYARRHFDQRMKVENQKDSLGIYAGMAHSELALGLLLNGRYEEAIENSRIARQILEKIPIYLSGDYWPHWAIIHEAWSLLGLNRPEEAVEILEESVKWRQNKYGPDDKEDHK
jgi:tetratricopeptide (TPR) repeat protein